MTDLATRLAGLPDERLLSLHKKADEKGPVEAAQIEAHHLISIELLKRGLQHGHIDDPWASAVIIKDTVGVSSPDDIDAPEGMEKAWVETLKDGGNVSILLTVDGYVLKADPTVSDVHVDSLMGGRRRRAVDKAEWKNGDFAVWGSSGGSARGQIEHIMRDGVLGIPDSDFSIKATEDDPAVLLRIFRKGPKGWAATETLVGHKMSTLRPIEDLTKEAGYPIPKGVQSAAKTALKWIADGRAGDGFTSVGRNRASQLAAGGTLSEATIVKMRAYFARHAVDKQAAGWGNRSDPTPGMVAWYAWGGDAGRTWSNKILGRVEKRAIPEAITDLHINIENRQHAIDEYLYGPMNPEEPGDYWERLGEVWDVPAEEAFTTHCDNCAAFNITPEIRTAIADAIGEGGEEVVTSADLGYCELFQFKCAAARSCSAWLVGGPIGPSDEDEDEYMEEGSTAVLKHPGHGSEKVHGLWATGGGSSLSSEGKSLIRNNLSRGGQVESYGESYRNGKEAKVFGQDHIDRKVSELIALRDPLISQHAGKPRSFESEGAAFAVASHQGFIDGALGHKAQFARSHNFSDMVAGLFGAGLSGATKSFEPDVTKHGAHDQKTHGNWAHGGGYSETVTRLIRRKPETIVMRGEAIVKGRDSAWQHTIPDGKGGYKFTPERQALHEEIISKRLEGKPSKENPVFVMMGGGGGSGKGTLIKSGKIENLPSDSDRVHIDADEIKMELPEYSRMIQEGNKTSVASYTHEESSILTKEIQRRAIENRNDILLDGTGDSTEDGLRKKITAPRDAGYEVRGEYTSAPTIQAWDQNVERAASGPRGLVPPGELIKAHKSVSQIVPKMSAEFDSFRLWDTSGGVGTQKVIATNSKGGKMKVLDAGEYKIFQAKATETLSGDKLLSEITQDQWKRIEEAI